MARTKITVEFDPDQVLALANFVSHARRKHPAELGPALAGAIVELDRAAVALIRTEEPPELIEPPAFEGDLAGAIDRALLEPCS